MVQKIGTEHGRDEGIILPAASVESEGMRMEHVEFGGVHSSSPHQGQSQRSRLHRPASVNNRMLITVGLEDYFHAGVFSRAIPEGHWHRFEKRIEESTMTTLDLFDRYNVRATFFVMGWVAEQIPELVREVAERGHEIANQGFSHRTISEMSREEFREDLLRSREALERATGMEIVGHRVPHFLTHRSFWALDVLAEEGVLYDSSLRPMLRQFAGHPFRRFLHEHHYGDHSIMEVPISTTQRGGLYLPLAVGNGLRQFPQAMGHKAVKDWVQQYQKPFVTYFHVWELDPSQPRISAAPFLSKVRHYRNLEKMESILASYFEEYECMGIAEHLGIDVQPLPLGHPSLEEPAHLSSDGLPAVTELFTSPRTPVSVVIPCYNESESLAYLKNTLQVVRRKLEAYDLHFIFVDDGSKDGTGDMLEDMFEGVPGHEVVRHEVNKGVAAAIMTGIHAAEHEIVCSMDCDCTYDPLEFKAMIPKLGPQVAMVTASPYHPDGDVVNVPEWRLFLSRGASFLYKLVLQEDLSTYTSCFRVYRRSKVVEVDLEEGHFLGVAELLCKLALSGENIEEHPATLESRIFGQSKMKTFNTIKGHLGLLSKFALQRMQHGKVTPTWDE